MRTWLRVTATALAALLAVAAVTVCILRTHGTWVEYYSTQGPYAGMTENMDKWKSPVLDLVVSNGAGLAFVAALGLGVRRMWRTTL